MEVQLISSSDGELKALTDAEYFSAHEYISTSDLKLAKSNPAGYISMKNGGPRKAPSKEMALGSELDSIAMHPNGFGFGVSIGDQPIATKARRAKATDKRIILSDSPLAKMLIALRSDPEAIGYLTAPGITQATIFYRSKFDVDGREVSLNRRAKIDRLLIGKKTTRFSTIVDLKTSRFVEPDEFAACVVRFGYHIQGVAYQDAVDALTGERPRVVLVVVQNCEPYATACYELTDGFIELGRRALDSLVGNYFRMSDAGEWRPSTWNKTTDLSPPRWAERHLHDWSY